MKTKRRKVLLALVTAAVMLFAAGCAANDGDDGQTGAGAGGTEQAESGEAGAAASNVQTAGPQETEPDAAQPAGQETESDAPQTAGQEMNIEQYIAMAKKFAFYSDSVYFDYQGDRGTVTILDVQVEEDNENQCRITVYYQEPALTGDNSYTDPTDGYMTFAIDKATAQGTMECWNYLGVPGEYLDEPVDQMDVAIFYSEFVYSLDDVYDFATGMILRANGSEPTDVIAYWDENALES